MSLRVLVVIDGESHAQGDARVDRADGRALLETLASLGHRMETVPAQELRLDLRVARFAPDVIIVDSESDARDTLEHVVMATRDAPRPIALVTGDEATDVRDLLRRGVSAYAVAGLGPERLQPVLEVAVARFEVEQQLRAELAASRARLDERRIVDRAKAALMRGGLTEDDAHRKLQRLAMDGKLRLVDVARRVIDRPDLMS